MNLYTLAQDIRSRFKIRSSVSSASLLAALDRVPFLGTPNKQASKAGVLQGTRDQRGFAWLSALGRDFRYAVRSLLRDRGSVALAVLALSLGIGATTIIFSVVYSVFIAAFPFADSPRVVQFRLQANGQDDQGWLLPGRRVRRVSREKQRLHERARWSGRHTCSTSGKASRTTPRFSISILADCRHLAYGPILGRELNEADGAEGAPPTFLISDRLWEWRFKRDPNILGMTLKLNGTARTLIGVLPPRFLLTRRRRLSCRRRSPRRPPKRASGEPARTNRGCLRSRISSLA